MGITGNQYEAGLARRRDECDLDGRLPESRGERCEIVAVGHARQAGEHVAQVSEWLDAVAQARDDNRVEDGAALSGFGVADEQPVAR